MVAFQIGPAVAEEGGGSSGSDRTQAVSIDVTSLVPYVLASMDGQWRVLPWFAVLDFGYVRAVHDKLTVLGGLGLNLNSADTRPLLVGKAGARYLPFGDGGLDGFFADFTGRYYFGYGQFPGDWTATASLGYCLVPTAVPLFVSANAGVGLNSEFLLYPSVSLDVGYAF